VLTWLVVGVAAYPVFLAGVIVVLRAAKARARAERATDAVTSVAPAALVADRPAPEGAAESDAGRGHPVPDEHVTAPQPGDPGTSTPPRPGRSGTMPPSSRARG
jgi:hypothetical protein